MLNALPDHLFRYCDFQGAGGAAHLEMASIENRFEFSTPEGFNHPFDCKPLVRFNDGADVARAFWRKHVTAQGRALLPDEDQCIEEMVTISLDESRWHELQQKAWKTMADSSIMCTSETVGSPSMWNHYSAGHKGICFRLRMKNAKRVEQWKVAPFQVVYGDDYPVVEFYTASHDALVRLAPRAKSRDWAYEQEWRLLSEEGPGVHKIPEGVVDEVYLGYLATPEFEGLVSSLLRNLEAPPRCFRMKADPGSFRLTPVEIGGTPPR